MRFVFNGITFSIGFRHDKSRSLGDHHGHNVCILRRIDGQLHDAGYGIWCSNCQMEIGQTVPKRLRDRKTHCVIRAHVNGDWRVVLAGTGDPNEQEGDRFTKEVGRRASLSNALARENWFTMVREWPAGLQLLANLRATFKQAAWASFNNRKGITNGN